MDLRKSFALLVGGVLIFTSQALAENTARALFMSTAESKISVPVENNKNTQGQQKVATKQTPKKQQNQVAYGFQFQVFLQREGKEVAVNPARYVFREGDRFRVQIVTNTPGIIMVSNRDPLGRETFLGSWPVEKAFSKVMIPAEGYFEFYGPKGEDLLYILFIPCRVEEQTIKSYVNSGVSRSIRVVTDETTERIRMKDEVVSKLPVCQIRPQNEREFYENKRQRDVMQATYSRSIRISYDEAENAGYVFHSSQGKSGRPEHGKSLPVDVAIFNVIKFTYR